MIVASAACIPGQEAVAPIPRDASACHQCDAGLTAAGRDFPNLALDGLPVVHGGDKYLLRTMSIEPPTKLHVHVHAKFEFPTVFDSNRAACGVKQALGWNSATSFSLN